MIAVVDKASISPPTAYVIVFLALALPSELPADVMYCIPPTMRNITDNAPTNPISITAAFSNNLFTPSKLFTSTPSNNVIASKSLIDLSYSE